MPHGRVRAALQVRDAADVGRHDGRRLQGLQVAQLAVAQRVGDLRLQHRIGTGRTTTQVRLVGGHAHIEAQRVQVRFHAAAQLLPVLQGAGWMKGNGRIGGGHAALQRPCDLGQQLAEIPRDFTDALCLVGIGGVVAQQVAIFLDRHAAARGVHDDGLHRTPAGRPTGLQIGPPGVDVGAHVRQPTGLVVQVKTHRAATAGSRRHQGLDARCVQHPGRGRLDIGHHGRLHAARQQQHLAGVHGGGPAACSLPRGHLVAQAVWQQRPHALAQRHGGAEQG